MSLICCFKTILIKSFPLGVALFLILGKSCFASTTSVFTDMNKEDFNKGSASSSLKKGKDKAIEKERVVASHLKESDYALPETEDLSLEHIQYINTISFQCKDVKKEPISLEVGFSISQDSKMQFEENLQMLPHETPLSEDYSSSLIKKNSPQKVPKLDVIEAKSIEELEWDIQCQGVIKTPEDYYAQEKLLKKRILKILNSDYPSSPPLYDCLGGCYAKLYDFYNLLKEKMRQRRKIIDKKKEYQTEEDNNFLRLWPAEYNNLIDCFTEVLKKGFHPSSLMERNLLHTIVEDEDINTKHGLKQFYKYMKDLEEAKLKSGLFQKTKTLDDSIYNILQEKFDQLIMGYKLYEEKIRLLLEQYKKEKIEENQNINETIKRISLLIAPRIEVFLLNDDTHYAVTEKTALELLEEGYSSSSTEAGDHKPVYKDGVYFKCDRPCKGVGASMWDRIGEFIAPGNEYKVYSLYKRLGIEIPPSTVLGFNRLSEEQGYRRLIQASLEVRGERFDRFLGIHQKNCSSLQNLNAINPESFSSQVTGAWISYPYDGRGDNYIAKSLHDGSHAIVCIDNDKSFKKPFDACQKNVKLKSILLCLPELMSKPFSLFYCKHLLSLDADQVFQGWEEDLKNQTEAYYDFLKRFFYDEEESLQMMGFNLESTVPINKVQQELTKVFKGNYKNTIFAMIKYLFRRTQWEADLKDCEYGIQGLFYNKGEDSETTSLKIIKSHRSNEVIQKIIKEFQLMLEPDNRNIFCSKLNFLQNLLSSYPFNKTHQLIFEELYPVEAIYYTKIKNHSTYGKDESVAINSLCGRWNPEFKDIDIVIDNEFLVRQATTVTRYLEAQQKENSQEQYEGQKISQLKYSPSKLDKAFLVQEIDPETIGSLIEQKIPFQPYFAHLAWKQYWDTHPSKVERSTFLEKTNFLSLLKPASELEWLVNFERFLLSNNQNNELIRIEGAISGVRYITKNISDHLLDNDGYIKNDENIKDLSQSPFRSVKKIDLQESFSEHLTLEGSLYFKQYPELPGLDFAVLMLLKHLKIEGVPHSELFKFYDKKGKPYPVLISQGIRGKTLHEHWKDKQADSFNDTLDEDHTFQMILAAMLIGPEDDKDDNLVLFFNSDEKFQFFSIDPNHAFLPTVSLEKKQKIFFKGDYDVLQLKTPLFCLPQMKKKFSERVAKQFKAIDPKTLLKNWLKDLFEMDQAYQRLFPKEETDNYLNNDSVVRVPIPSYLVKVLYSRLQMVKYYISNEMTPLKLLSKTLPYPAKHYGALFKNSELKTPYDKFHFLIKPLYNHGRNKLGQLNSNYTSRQILELMKIDFKKLCEGQDPSVILKELETILFDEDVYQKESRLLYYEKALPDRNIRALLSLGKNILKLQISDCEDINGHIYFALKEMCPQLKILELTNCPKLKWLADTTTFSGHKEPLRELKTLDVSGSDNLHTINLTLPFLNFFKANECIKLETIQLRSPKLLQMEVKGCPTVDRRTLESYLWHKQNDEPKKLFFTDITDYKNWINEKQAPENLDKTAQYTLTIEHNKGIAFALILKSLNILLNIVNELRYKTNTEIISKLKTTPNSENWCAMFVGNDNGDNIRKKVEKYQLISENKEKKHLNFSSQPKNYIINKLIYLKALEPSYQINNIDLSNNQLGDNIVILLKKMPLLKTLNLKNNNFTDKGLIDLLDTQITEIDLRENKSLKSSKDDIKTKIFPRINEKPFLILKLDYLNKNLERIEIDNLTYNFLEKITYIDEHSKKNCIFLYLVIKSLALDLSDTERYQILKELLYIYPPDTFESYIYPPCTFENSEDLFQIAQLYDPKLSILSNFQKDVQKAIEHYERAFAKDHALAAHNLGTLFYYGSESLSKDGGKAKYYLKEAQRLLENKSSLNNEEKRIQKYGKSILSTLARELNVWIP